jgi:hypothetical protein
MLVVGEHDGWARSFIGYRLGWQIAGDALDTGD